MHSCNIFYNVGNKPIAYFGDVTPLFSIGKWLIFNQLNCIIITNSS